MYHVNSTDLVYDIGQILAITRCSFQGIKMQKVVSIEPNKAFELFDN